MKKFSLLALVAVMVMAFAGAAFATDGDLSAFAAYSAPGNMGEFDQDWDATKSKDIEAPLYYFNSDQKVDITAVFSGTADTNENAGSTTATADVFDPKELGHSTAPTATLTGQFSASNQATFTVKDVSLDLIPENATATLAGVAGYDAVGFGKASAPDKVADLTLNFTPVSFMVTSGDATLFPTLTIDNTASTPIDSLVLSNDLGATITYSDLNVALLDADGKVVSDPTPTDDLVVPNLGNVKIEAASGKITVTPRSPNPKGGVYKVAIVTTASTTAEIGAAEIAGLNGVSVKANLILAELEIVVTRKATKSATPASVTMREDLIESLVISTDISSTDVAAASSKDIKVSLVSSNDLDVKSFDLQLRNGDYYDVTVSDEFLKTLGVGQHTFQVYDTAEKNVTNNVVLTIDAKPVVPPYNAPANAAADPNNSLLAPTSNDVADVVTVNTFVSPDVTGLDLMSGPGSSYVTPDAVVRAISDDNNIGIWGSKNVANVTPLPIVDANIQNNGTIATIRFVGIHGSTLVSGDTSGNGVRRVSANDLNIIKLVASKDVTALKRVGNVTDKKSADLDGKYNVYLNGTLVDTVSSSGDNYELRVYIADNGKYDLAKSVNGKVVDPLAIVKSTGASHSSSSSCDMGFGLAAVAGLAALALRKRSK